AMPPSVSPGSTRQRSASTGCRSALGAAPGTGAIDMQRARCSRRTAPRLPVRGQPVRLGGRRKLEARTHEGLRDEVPRSPCVAPLRADDSAEVLVDQLGHLEHRDGPFATEDGPELVVGVDVPPLLRILEVVLADVGPELLPHFRPGNWLVTDNLRQVLRRHELLHECGVGLALRSRGLLGLLRGLLGHSFGFSSPSGRGRCTARRRVDGFGSSKPRRCGYQVSEGKTASEASFPSGTILGAPPDMQALITGANGFLGSALARRLLSAGHTVRALLRPGADPSALAGLGVERVEGDVTVPSSLPRAVAGADVVVHLAGLRRSPERAAFFPVHAEGTRAVCDAMLRSGARRLVLAGSLAAVGPSEPGRPHRETDPFAPREWYGESKAEAERIALASGLEVSVARPPRILGPGDRENLVFFRLVRRGIRLRIGGGPRPLSVVDVDDVVELLLLQSSRPEAVG